MSDVHPRARHGDPLDALRAADHRPLADVWRERWGVWLRDHTINGLRSRGIWLVGIAAVAAIVWQLFAASEPPVEDSIPLAEPAPATAPTSSRPAVVVPLDESASVDIAESSTQIVIHVAGAVRGPGLVRGAPGWRIDDAVSAAGGATGSADLDRLNLAALVEDGQRIFVPSVGESEPAVVSPTGGSSEGSASPTGEPRVVNINSASQIELETLPGVGPATAATIVSHREEYGHFADVEALVAVRGIGPATLEALRDFIRVS